MKKISKREHRWGIMWGLRGKSLKVSVEGSRRWDWMESGWAYYRGSLRPSRGVWTWGIATTSLWAGEWHEASDVSEGIHLAAGCKTDWRQEEPRDRETNINLPPSNQMVRHCQQTLKGALWNSKSKMQLFQLSSSCRRSLKQSLAPELFTWK